MYFLKHTNVDFAIFAIHFELLNKKHYQIWFKLLSFVDTHGKIQNESFQSHNLNQHYPSKQRLTRIQSTIIIKLSMKARKREI